MSRRLKDNLLFNHNSRYIILWGLFCLSNDWCNAQTSMRIIFTIMTKLPTPLKALQRVYTDLNAVLLFLFIISFAHRFSFFLTFFHSFSSFQDSHFFLPFKLVIPVKGNIVFP